MRLLTLNEGELLVRLARRAVEEYLLNFIKINPPKDVPKKLLSKYGVFVTIETIIKNDQGKWERALRGCIGYPEPLKPLIEATIDAAIAAAVEDPRFPPMRANELDSVIFEVSVLTPPQKVRYSKPEELLKLIKIGRDGIIVEKGMFKGLLLPQVPVEYKWDIQEYLANACIKAGLPPNSWKNGSVNIYVFQAQIFAEIFPRDKVIERVLI